MTNFILIPSAPPPRQGLAGSTNAQPNQISFGLVITPANLICVYMIPLGMEISASHALSLCPLASNAAFLPLKGLRVRRLNQPYPYNGIQGYRTGNNVDVVTYMQKNSAVPLPPPATVIAYMVNVVNSFLIGFGMTLFNLMYGSINLLPDLNPEDSVHFSRGDGSFWRSFGNVTAANSITQISTYHYICVSTHSFDGYEITTEHELVGNVVNVTVTLKNLLGVVMGDMYLSRTFDPGPDSDAQYGGINETQNQSGYGSIPKERIVHATGVNSGAIVAIYTPAGGYPSNTSVTISWASVPVDVFNNTANYGPVYDDSAIEMGWQLGDIDPGQSKTVSYQLLIGDDLSQMTAGLS